MKASPLKEVRAQTGVIKIIAGAALLAAGLELSLFVSVAADLPLLSGRITSASGQPVAGVPVRAHRDNSSITVSAYTNGRGDYSFPEWSQVTPGSYSVAIEVPDFTPIKRAIMLSAGKTTRLDLAIEAREPTIDDATVGEIAAAMPGTEDQKFLLSQCGQCHSLQFALKNARNRDAWLRTVTRMAGARRATEDPPGTRAFDQKRYIEPTADFLASIRGPGSSPVVPFKFRPRPAAEGSTRILVTEFDIPRGGKRDLSITRGDRRFAWPHDVEIDSNGRYIWYTDHFTDILGRLDRTTGEVKEFPFVPPARRNRNGGGNVDDPTGPQDGRAGEPGGGAHKITFAPDGRLVIGTGGGTVVFDPKTEEFKTWPAGSVMFGVDRASNVWYVDRALHRLDLKTGDVKTYPAPPNAGGYDVDIDSKGRFVYNGWRTGKMGVFDPETEKFVEYQVPTPASGPRRGEFDAKDRYWFSLYWAGRLAMLEPAIGKIREFPLLPDTKPFGWPYLAPYTASVDDKNQLVWTTDLNSARIYRFDVKTETFTEYFMPAPYELRDLTVDRFAGRPTVWLPAYRPQSKIVKVEVW
jgi:virginiamycin B lyase